MFRVSALTSCSTDYEKILIHGHLTAAPAAGPTAK